MVLCRRAGRAFTLIELLVVVAIIAALMAILLPSLAQAREQGKIAKCLSNLRNLMTTTHTYFVEYNDEFPFVTRTGGYSSWYYGGKTNDAYWDTPARRYAFFRANERPLNRTMRNGAVEHNDPMREFRCPSDRRSHQRLFSAPISPNEIRISGYDDVGTSYHYNLGALIGTNLSRRTTGGIVTTPARMLQLSRTLIRDGRAGLSGRFTLFFENGMDYGLYSHLPIIGDHGRVSRYSAGFLDGHAELKYMDTRGYCGTGWVAINPNWVRQAGARQEIYYESLAVNCDPR